MLKNNHVDTELDTIHDKSGRNSSIHPQCSCTRLTASTHDISSKSAIHSLWFTIDDFDIGGLVGDGAHGQVFLARERRTGFICVLKCIPKVQLVGSGRESMFKHEIEMHSHLRHPNISCLYTWFTTSTMIYMVMEYCYNGDLYTHLMINKRFDEKRVSEMLFEITWAVRTCHDKHIAHLDIKPENILLDHNFSCKLADFGLSAHIEGFNINHMRGTYDYWSPEQCAYKYKTNKFGEFNQKSDVWTLGVLAFELYFGVSPFGTTCEESVETVLSRIQNYTWCKYWVSKYGSLYISDISSEFKDFLDLCFTKDSGKRPTASTLLYHPWLKLHNKGRYVDDVFINQHRI
ncbi:protein kinase domain containing protein [Theileria equi strain WA]|uniref:Aurora kinase n=1 Tax=Theileria equi strain WA TaxID=1537102 RepID=L0AVL0_THEEQ|nr:protein kinase domain containing protein [Theileria equi strain WA]AFZ79061.1 protein kinase domain containing protein [Theileria equi strain WA]|eukprot:XP_004828727.1 protein kinase domain containing protein [Theileria equi strain WA]